MAGQKEVHSGYQLIGLGLLLRLVVMAISGGDASAGDVASLTALVESHGIAGALADPISAKFGVAMTVWAALAHNVALGLDLPILAAWKCLPLATEAASVALIIAWSRRRGDASVVSVRRGALVALSPAAIIATGHVGAASVVLGSILLAAAIASASRRFTLSGLFLGAAVMVDLSALVVVAAVVAFTASREAKGRPIAVLRLCLPVIATCIVVVLCSLKLTDPWLALSRQGGEHVLASVPLIGVVAPELRTLPMLAGLCVLAAVFGVVAHRRGADAIDVVTAAMFPLVAVLPVANVAVLAFPLMLVVLGRWRPAIWVAVIGGLGSCLFIVLASTAETPLVSPPGDLPMPVIVSTLALSTVLFGVAASAVVRRPISLRARLPFAVLWASIAALAGGAFAVGTPPFQVADEPLHAIIGCAAGQGQLTPGVDADGDIPYTYDAPRSLIELHRTIGKMALPHQFRRRVDMGLLSKAQLIPASKRFERIQVFQETGEIGVYPPVMYWPQAIACRWAIDGKTDPWRLLLSMRLANLAAYILMASLALLVIRHGREVLAVILLCPMALSSAASASGDGQLLAWTALTVALVSRWMVQGQALPRVMSVAMILSAFALSMAKSVYVPFAFAWLLLPASRFSSPRHRAGTIIAVVVAAGVGGALWIPVSREGLEAWASSRHLVPDELMAERLKEPFAFVATILKTLARERILRGIPGQLGWLDVVLPVGAAMTFWVSLLLALTAAPRGRWVSAWRGIGLVVLAGGSLVGLHLFYAGYGAQGDTHVLSVQGRHVIPSLLFGVVGVSIWWRAGVWRPLARLVPGLVLAASGATLLMGLAAVETRYYAKPVDADVAFLMALDGPPKPVRKAPAKKGRPASRLTPPLQQSVKAGG